MIFVYPYGGERSWGDMEIYLSMSSILRYFKGNAEFYVVGEKPEIDIDFTFITAQQSESRYKNVANNLAVFIQKVNPSSFILMNDDFFATKEFSIDGIKMWYDKTVYEKVKNGKSLEYIRVLSKGMKNKKDLNFAVHFPMPVWDVTTFYACCLMAQNTDLSIRNIYGNIAMGDVVQKYDIKIRNPINKKDLEKLLLQGWISHGDGALTEAYKNELKNICL